MDYYEKYGDDGYFLDGIELEEAQRKIDEEEKQTIYEKGIKEIIEITKRKRETFEETEECIEKIREIVEEL